MSNSLFTELKATQMQITGLFKAPFHNKYVPAIEYGGMITCIEIGDLLGLTELHIAVDQGHYIPFPETGTIVQGNVHSMTLTEMMENPIWFNQWYKDNVPKTTAI